MKTEELIIKVKKTNPDAVIPTYAKPGDAGMDLTAVSKEVDIHGNIVYATGLAFEIPEGYFMMLVPRSSNCKTDLVLTNHCGVVDSGYRGEIFFKYGVYRGMRGNLDFVEHYEIGDRIGQLIIMPYPKVSFQEVDDLSETERGKGSYGSTGK